MRLKKYSEVVDDVVKNEVDNQRFFQLVWQSVKEVIVGDSWEAMLAPEVPEVGVDVLF